MKKQIFLLNAIDGADYDCAEGFVVRATSEQEARAIASTEQGDEKREGDFWTNQEKSSCEVVPVKGDVGIILRAFHAA